VLGTRVELPAVCRSLSHEPILILTLDTRHFSIIIAASTHKKMLWVKFTDTDSYVNVNQRLTTMESSDVYVTI